MVDRPVCIEDGLPGGPAARAPRDLHVGRDEVGAGAGHGDAADAIAAGGQQGLVSAHALSIGVDGQAAGLDRGGEIRICGV